MKKSLFITSLVASSIVSSTSAFAHETLTSNEKPVKQIIYVQSSSSGEYKPLRRSKRSIGAAIDLATTTKVENVVGPWSEKTSQLIGDGSYYLPGGTMTISESFESSFGGNIDIDILSAKLGFNLSASHTISRTQNITVPNGKRAYVKAFRADSVWRYDIIKRNWFGDITFEQTHWARKPNGVYFEITYFNN